MITSYTNFDLELEGVGDVTGEGDLHFSVHVPARLREPERSLLTAAARDQIRRLRERRLTTHGIRDLGSELARLLFPGQVRELLREAWRTRPKDQGLRIRLKAVSPVLAGVPWECCFLPEKGFHGLAGFLGQNPLLSLARFEVFRESDKDLHPVEGRLRLVALFASAPGFENLDLKAEEQSLRDCFAQLPGCAIDLYPDATVRMLRDALEAPTHIFHFGGHGSFHEESSGAIHLFSTDSPDKRAASVSCQQLVDRLRTQSDTLRLVVLNACDTAHIGAISPGSGLAPGLIRLAGIPAVIGMQFRIDDACARVFNECFYSALVKGASIDAALTLARQAIFNECRGKDPDNYEPAFRDWAAPVLYLQSNQAVLFPERGPTITSLRKALKECKPSRADLEKLCEAIQDHLRARGVYRPILLHHISHQSDLDGVIDDLVHWLVDQGFADDLLNVMPPSAPTSAPNPAIPQHSFTNTLRAQTLRKELDALAEEYQAVSNQLLQEINYATQVKLKRQLDQLEAKMKKIEQELS
ncbi:MAG: CHAT domain-containing protein [Chloroflexales bacterium]